MEKTKLRYEVPEAETFVVRFEGVLCQSRGIQNSNPKKASTYGWDDWDDLDEE